MSVPQDIPGRTQASTYPTQEGRDSVYPSSWSPGEAPFGTFPLPHREVRGRRFSEGSVAIQTHSTNEENSTVSCLFGAFQKRTHRTSEQRRTETIVSSVPYLPPVLSVPDPAPPLPRNRDKRTG